MKSYRKILLYGVLSLMIFSACASRENSVNDMPYRFSETGAIALSREWNDEAEVYFGGMASPATENVAMYDAPMTEEAGQVDREEVAERSERHVIQNASVEMETEEFDRVVNELREIISDTEKSETAGYIESEMYTTHGRKIFTIVMRVPAQNFMEILEQTKKLATVRVVHQSAQDVTDSFYDLRGNLETKLIEEERILALIDDAETIQDLLALETRLSNTRRSIETYRSRLNNMAGQIAFSTISVTLYDIYEEKRIITTPTLGERIGGAFGDSVDGTSRAAQDIIVFLAGAVIPVAIIGIFVCVIILFVKLIRRKARQTS